MQYRHYDGMLSTRIITNLSGAPVGEYRYDAFGKIIESTAPVGDSHLYTAEHWEEEIDAYYLRSERRFAMILSPGFPWYIRARGIARGLRRALPEFRRRGT